MSIPTVNVLVTVHEQDGSPAVGAQVIAKLMTTERYNGFVVPDEYSGITNSDGNCTISLFPNELGTEGSEYKFKIIHRNGKTVNVFASIPNYDCSLHQVSELDRYELRGAGNIIASEVLGYANDAIMARDNARAAELSAANYSIAAGEKATDATAQAGIATTKANEASASATSALSSANSATTSMTNAATSATSANAAKVSAEAARDLANTHKVDSQAARDKAELWAEQATDVTVETGKYSAKHHATKAAASATAASTSKDTATTKANEAAASATAAANSATSASTSATTATTQAGNAQTSANAASVSAGNASNSAATATQKATDAANSATAAQASATNAANSASAAATSKTGADSAKVAAETARDAAQASATAADGSKTAAASSATSASTSATNAANSASAASTSATVAATSAMVATEKAIEAESVVSFARTLPKVVRSQSLPPVGNYAQGTFCVVDAYIPKKVYLNIGLAWIEIPAWDSYYQKITKYDDVALLWRDSDGGLISAIGDNPNWSYAGRMYAEDGSYVGVNEPVNMVGKVWPWDSFTNIALYSEDFNNSSWVKARTTIASDIIAAPDGTLVADKLIEDTTATNTHYANQTVYTTIGERYYFSIYVKPAGRTAIYLRINDVCNGYFDVANGSILSGSSGSEITLAGNGWYRCVITGVAIATGAAVISAYLIDTGTNITYTGDGTSGVYLWGAQLTKTSRQMPYIKTTSAAITVKKGDVLTSSMPWYEWSGPSYTNLLTYSEQFDNAAWTKSNGTVSQNAITAPDGSLSGDLLVANGTAPSLYRNHSFTSGVRYTLSGYFKAQSIPYLRVRVDGISYNRYAHFNIANGTIGATGSDLSVKMDNVGNGWYRCSVSWTATASGVGTVYFYFVDADNGTTATYDGVTGSFVWGAQLATTSGPVPYIKTEANPVTVNSLPIVPAIHGDKGVWCGPSYSNLLPLGADMFGSATWSKSSSGIPAPLIDSVKYSGPTINMFAERVSFGAATAINQQGMLYRSLVAVPSIGVAYTFSLWARADQPCSMFIGLTQGGGPEPGVFNKCQVTTDWQLFHVTYTTTKTTVLYVEIGPDTRTAFDVDQDATQAACSVYLSGPQGTATNAPMPYVPPGTTVASAAGTSGNNGLWWDMAKESDGVELVYNGGFNTNVDGWRTDDATIAAVNGRMEVTTVGDYGRATQGLSLVIGAKYRVTGTVYNVSGNTNTSVYISTSSTGGATSLGGPLLASSGMFSFEFTATQTPLYIVLQNNSAAASVNAFDNISVQRLTSPLMKCFEKAETDGVELVTNGGFDVDTSGWDTGTTNTLLAWEAGEAKSTRTGSASADAALIRQSISTQNGAFYRVSFDAYSPTYIGTLRVDNGSYGAAISSNVVSTGRPVSASKQRYSVIIIANGTASIRINAGSIAFTTNEVIYFDNISVQKLKPATCTVAAEVTMGVGSGDIANNTVIPGVTVRDINNGGLYSGTDGAGGGRIISGYDATTATHLVGSWSRNERHIKIVQTNADGTKFRVGNKRVGIDATIQWGSWANFDGSFNPLTALRLAYGNTVPLWFKRVMVSNRGGMTDAEILARMEA